MIPPAEVEMTRDDFERVARAMFDADDATLEALYPMVRDLRALAARVSGFTLNDGPLSETATGQ